MTSLHRVRIIPSSPWRTPWQADTLLGALCATCARVHGQQYLRDRLLDPMLRGQPPFVLSDAFPGDLMPLPVHLRLHPWRDDQLPPGGHKALKRARWLSPSAFKSALEGQVPPISDFLSDDLVLSSQTRQHNTLSRVTDTTFSSEQGGGGLFARPDFHLAPRSQSTTQLDPRDSLHLTLYFRLLDPGAADLLLDLLHELSLTGFGADTATGRGQFDLADPQPVPDLDRLSAAPNAVLCLSTFQPAPADPTEGLWESFPKFGKLGPDFSLDNQSVRKNTIILFRPGSVFRTDPARPFLGHALPMRSLLPQSVAAHLESRDIHVLHPAFGLCLPIIWHPSE